MDPDAPGPLISRERTHTPMAARPREPWPSPRSWCVEPSPHDPVTGLEAVGDDATTSARSVDDARPLAGRCRQRPPKSTQLLQGTGVAFTDCIWSAINQPTTVQLNTSRTAQPYTFSPRVGCSEMSAHQRRSGASATNFVRGARGPRQPAVAAGAHGLRRSSSPIGRPGYRVRLPAPWDIDTPRVDI